MKRILVDSSVWIDFLNTPHSIYSEKLANALHNDKVCLCPPIFQEVIQGVRKESDVKWLTDFFLDLEHLEADPYHVATSSATIYRTLRKEGITIRKSWDCQIAWFALAYNIELLHNDRDFESIAKVYPLRLL